MNTAIDPDLLRATQTALLEAEARARARGLSEEEIEQESNDDDSQLCAEVRMHPLCVEWRARKRQH